MPTCFTNHFIRCRITPIIVGLLIMGCFPASGYATQVRVAVASNFLSALQTIAKNYQQQTGQNILISSGSTGKLYAQIVNGAPFDIFLAANSREPQRLESAGKVVEGSRFTYALGQLVLWGPEFVDKGQGLKSILSSSNYQRISIANPKTAPYGAASIEALMNIGLYDSLKGRIIRGENVSQAYQYVASGAAQLGFVALSQLKVQIKKQLTETNRKQFHYWVINPELYSPIQQQGILLKRAEQNKAAFQFMQYLKTVQSRATIKDLGYLIEVGKGK